MSKKKTCKTLDEFCVLNNLTLNSEAGSPNGSIHRTFRAVFEMPVVPFKHNLIKIGKRQYRNPICLAQEWQKALDTKKYVSPAALARSLKISRARVTQVLNLLQLSPEAIKMISSLGDPLRSPIVAERRLRQLSEMAPEKQIEQIKILIFGPISRRGSDLTLSVVPPAS